MSSWEYKVVPLPSADATVDEEILNVHGSKGWELIAVQQVGSGRTCFFKRIALESKIPDAETLSMKAVVPSPGKKP